MSQQQQSATVIAGRMIGVFRLRTLISALELEIKGMKGRFNAYMILKRELGCKGSRAGVLKFAREVLADVSSW